MRAGHRRSLLPLLERTDVLDRDIQSLLRSVTGPYSLQELTAVLDAQDRLHLILEQLETAVAKKPTSAICTALAKIYVGLDGMMAATFLRENDLYETGTVGSYCEQRGAIDLALTAFGRGQCDGDMLRLAREHQKHQAVVGYALVRRDAGLWRQGPGPGLRVRAPYWGRDGRAAGWRGPSRSWSRRWWVTSRGRNCCWRS